MEYDLVRLDTVADLLPGDQIAVKRLLKNLNPGLSGNLDPVSECLCSVVSSDEFYYHHGVYLGNGKVAHLHGENKNDAKPRRCDIGAFCSRSEVDGAIYKVIYRDEAAVLSVDDTLRRADQVLAYPEKWPKYDIIGNNCETFAIWLKTGRGFSFQAWNRVCYGMAVIILLGALAFSFWRARR